MVAKRVGPGVRLLSGSSVSSSLHLTSEIKVSTRQAEIKLLTGLPQVFREKRFTVLGSALGTMQIIPMTIFIIIISLGPGSLLEKLHH